MAPLFARLRSFGVDDTRLKALAKDHTTLLRKYRGDPSSLEENVRFLSRHGLNDTQMADAVKKHPALLLLDVASDLEPRGKFLMEQGLSPSAIAAILSSCPAIMTTNTKDLIARIAYLSRAGISRKFLSSCVVKHPALLSHDVDQKLRPVLKVLSDRLAPQVVRNLVAIVPAVFARKPEMVDDLISAFKYIGFQGEVDTWLQSMSWGVRFGPEAVRDKIDFLMSMDIHYRHVAVMLKAEPHILQVDNAVLKEKLDFLFKGMKLDVEELLKCPAYLSKKSMDRVKIRWKVLSLLKSRGIIQRIHLKDMVTLPRKWFVETFVFKYPDCGRVYYGERSALKQARAEARGERSTCSLQALATQDRLTSDLSPCELRALRISPWIVRKPWIHSWLLRGVHQNKKANSPVAPSSQVNCVRLALLQLHHQHHLPNITKKSVLLD
ncbi:hypothetical protein SELMODRAFT_419725 [Selaginella moellendorffii]|uniref:Uncharacterized protein n=1 Tax=Selaginella moellendorffii TaxID=88036 RepID=D8S9U9_SELML|nr:hypothetical protein SELMODRAFT_419725 [Selaginella moellendorffii]